jgi:hypothetical protein
LAQIRLWPAARLTEALDRLIQAEARIKTNAQPKDAIAERALLEVASLARSPADGPRQNPPRPARS